MNNRDSIMLICLGLSIGMLFGILIENNEYKKFLIKNEMAKYSEKDGSFQYLNKSGNVISFGGGE